MVEMEKRQKIAKDFYDRVLDLDEHPLIVTDEASFYDIYMGDDPEAIDIIYKEYGVTLSRENFQMPFWKMLDLLYASNQ